MSDQNQGYIKTHYEFFFTKYLKMIKWEELKCIPQELENQKDINPWILTQVINYCKTLQKKNPEL